MKEQDKANIPCQKCFPTTAVNLQLPSNKHDWCILAQICLFCGYI